MFKINSESELINLLKIISEEAVKSSKKSLNEGSDPAHAAYANNIKASESFYGVSLSEQEEAESGEKESKPSTGDSEPEEVEEEAPEEEVDAEKFGVSFDSVVKDINNLRAGRSTKDKEIKEELLTYYDRLDEDERKILHLFLRELSKILQGALDGEDAIDPSDAPLYADIIMQKSDSEESDSEQSDTPKAQKRSNQTSTSTPGKSGEDTSPPLPVSVNESQNLQEIRKKVFRLMKRM